MDTPFRRPHRSSFVWPGARACRAASPTRAVGPALALDIEDPRFRGRLNGTTHMMMLGTTNLAVFDFFLEWASENIRNPIVETACRAGQEPPKK